MRYSNISLIVFLLFYCSCSKDKQTEGLNFDEAKNLSFHIENIDFEQSEDGDPGFYYVSEVRVDNEGNMYVLDDQELKVKIFNSRGKKLWEFGGEGRGPGEFQRFSGFDVEKEKGKITVFDNRSMRITELSKEGELLNTFTNEKFNVQIKFIDSGDRRVVLHSTFEPVDNDPKLGFLVNSQYEIENSFLKATEIKEKLRIF